MVCLIISGFFLGLAFADEFSTDNISTVETQVENDLDKFEIFAQTETVKIQVIKKFLDAEDNVLRTENGRNFIYRNVDDNPATDEDETDTSFTTFLQQLGITKADIKSAVNYMEGL